MVLTWFWSLNRWDCSVEHQIAHMPHSSSHVTIGTATGVSFSTVSKCSLHSHDKHHQHLQAYWMVSHFLQLLKLNQNKKISSLLSYIIQSLSQFLNSFDPCCNMPGFLMFCGEIFLLLERQAHLLSSDSCGWSEYRERAWPWWPRNQSGDLCCHSYNYMDTLSPDN